MHDSNDTKTSSPKNLPTSGCPSGLDELSSKNEVKQMNGKTVLQTRLTEDKIRELEAVEQGIKDKQKDSQNQSSNVNNEITSLETTNQKAAQEKQELRDQLDIAKQDLEDANQENEQGKKVLQTQLEEAEQEKNNALEDTKKSGEEKIILQTQLNTVKREKRELQTKLAQFEEKDKQIKESNEQVQKLQWGKEKLEIDNPGIANLQQKLKTKDDEIAQLKRQQPSARVEELEKELAAENTRVQQLQQKSKVLEAQKQPDEQPKPGKALMYTAAVGVSLATGLAAFIASGHKVRLDIWVTVGIVVVAALAISSGTYLAFKPSTQVGEIQELQNANVKDCCKV